MYEPKSEDEREELDERLYELRECKNGKEFKVEIKGKLPGGIATVDEIRGELNYIY